MKYLEGKASIPESGIVHYLPYFLIFTANIFWTLAWIHSNQYSISFAETSLIRGISTMSAAFLVSCTRGIDITYKSPANFKILFIRNILQCVQGMAMGFSQFVLPLPIVHTIGCTGSIFVFIVDYFKNGVTINVKQFVGIVFGVIGSLLCVNAELILNWMNGQVNQTSDFENYLTTDPFLRALCGILYLFIMMLWAFACVSTKDLRGVSTFGINFHLGVLLVLTSSVVYMMQDKHTGPHRFGLGLIFSGIPFIIAHFLFIGALTMTKNTGVLTIINFTTILYSYLLSIFIYNESPNMIMNSGVVLVFAGVGMSIFMKNKSN